MKNDKCPEHGESEEAKKDFWSRPWTSKCTCTPQSPSQEEKCKICKDTGELLDENMRPTPCEGALDKGCPFLGITPPQSWEEEFDNPHGLFGEYSGNVVRGMVNRDNTKKFIKNLLSYREELLKQRCLEALSEMNEVEPLSAGDLPMHHIAKAGYKRAISDAKEAVTRVFGDE